MLINSCSETKVKDARSKSPTNPSLFNDFIPAYLYNIPSFEIQRGTQIDQIIGKYKIFGNVDTINASKVYLKITDSLESTIYRGPVLDGKKDGWWEVSNNKTLLCCGNYILNKKNGYWRYFKLTGETQKIVNFKNDTIEGLAQEYTVDSILLAEGYYVSGLKSDFWKFFYNNGNIKEQGYFYDGYKSEWWQSFEANGNLNVEASYSRNEISGYMKKYSQGILSEEGKLYNGIRKGMWKSYDETGKLKRLVEHED